MHVVYVISPGGGPEAFIKTLLPWLERKGHRVSVVYTVASVDKAHTFPPHVQVRFAPVGNMHYYLSKIIRDYKSWSLRLRAWEEARAAYKAIEDIDASDPVDMVEVTEGSAFPCLCRRWPVVVRAHGSAWTFRHFCRDGVRRWDGELIRLEARQLSCAGQVTAISAHLADHLAEFCQLPRQRIQVLPYPVDTEKFCPEGLREILSGAPALMSVGRLEHRKGTDVLLQALGLLWERFPGMQLYLFGSEAQFTQGELLDMVPPDHRRQVIFPGFVPHGRLPAYYRAATVYLAPTQYETFGYTILEAMACGCPVVSCEVGAVPELIQDGYNGVLVPFGEVESLAAAVASLLENQDTRRSMGRNGAMTAAQYSLDLIGPLYEDMYQQAHSIHRSPGL